MVALHLRKRITFLSNTINSLVSTRRVKNVNLVQINFGDLIRVVPGQNNQRNPTLITNFQNKHTTAGIHRQEIISMHH